MWRIYSALIEYDLYVDLESFLYCFIVPRSCSMFIIRRIANKKGVKPLA